MKITLIITTYNWSESLFLVLKSIENQTIFPFEVIIADDGSKNNTKKLITNFKKKSKLTIIHSWQEDKGFRVASSRNKAILKSSGDYIILIDGDVILHPKFVADHIDNSEKGYFIQGTRALLSEDLTGKVLTNERIKFSFFSIGVKNRKNIIHSLVLSKIFANKHSGLRGIKSCNMSFFLNDCLKINGFNNDFEGWGKEDSEFAVRLINSGVSRKDIRFSAIQFHLWHNENTRASLDSNKSILQNAINTRSQWCENGINKIKEDEN